MYAIIRICLVVVLALAAAGVPCAQAVSTGTQRTMHVAPAGHIGGSSLAVAARAGYAFVGSSAEFSVIDIGSSGSRAGSPQPQRVAYLPVAANAVALRGQYAYVTNKGGLSVIDIADPRQPRQTSAIAAPAALSGLTIAGDTLYAVGPKAGLLIYDLADPAHPQSLGELRIAGAEGIGVLGSHTYLATGSGLQIVNVADARHPARIAFAGISRPVEGIAAAGHYIYLSVMPGALLVADAADRSAPEVVGSVSLPTYTKNLHVAGSEVFVANGVRGVAVVDAADPQRPRLRAAAKVGSLVTNVQSAGELVLATDVSEGGLHILRREGQQLLEAGVFLTPGITHDVAVQDGYAYLAAGMDGDIAVVDYNAVANLAGVGSYRTPMCTTMVRADADHLYAYSGNNRLQVLGIADPAHPVAEGSYQFPAGARIVAVQDNLAFLADGAGLLHIYAASSESAPHEIGLFVTNGEVNDAVLTDTFVLIAAGGQGVLAARYGGTSDLTPFQRIPLAGHAQQIVADGSAVYVLTSEGDLFALNLAAPLEHSVTDRVALGVQANGFVLRDGRLYIAAGPDGIYVLDVSDPREVGPITVYDTPGTALSVEVHAGRIFVADGFAGFLVLAPAEEAESQ